LIFQQRDYPERQSSQTAKAWSPSLDLFSVYKGSGEPIENKQRA
jgi:hypothetical protein